MLACEQAAPRVFAARSRVLVRLASLRFARPKRRTCSQATQMQEFAK